MLWVEVISMLADYPMCLRKEMITGWTLGSTRF